MAFTSKDNFPSTASRCDGNVYLKKKKSINTSTKKKRAGTINNHSTNEDLPRKKNKWE